VSFSPRTATASLWSAALTAIRNLSSSRAVLKLLLEDNFSRLCSLSSSRAPHQQLLNVAHTTLLSRGYTLQEYSDDGFRKN
jgi:hypothetical protein